MFLILYKYFSQNTILCKIQLSNSLLTLINPPFRLDIRVRVRHFGKISRLILIARPLRCERKNTHVR